MVQNMDKVTFIIPAYNAELTIGKCLESIIHQTYKNLEILIINDGSTDETEAVCRSYQAKDPRIKILSQKNAGVSAARNKGISMATGKFLQFVDADDYIESDMTQKLVEKANGDVTVGLVICGCLGEKDGQQTIVPTAAKDKMERIELLRALLEPDSVRGYLVNKLFYKNIIDEANLLMRTDIHVCEDLIFCIEYAAFINKAVYVKHPYYHYVYREDSVTHKKFSPKRFSVLKAFEEIEKITDPYKDKELDKKVEAHYLILIIQLWAMLIRNHYSYKTKEMKYIMKNMKKRKLCLWGTNWDMKYKVTCVPIKILSYIFG